MFWRHKAQDDIRKQRESEANAALEQSYQDYLNLQALKPEVEATVKGHVKLQLENHFAERIWIAYRGEY
jgi:hypothetical protein